MAIRKIITIGDDLLRKKSKPVEKFDSKLHELLDDMYESMLYYDGIGISAVQVGVLRRCFITEFDGKKIEFINPTIISQSGKNKYLIEGCLSVPGQSGPVERPAVVVVEAYDRYGNKFTYEAKDYSAKAICHEYDHLDGILYIDKLVDKKNRKKNKE